MEIALIGYGKMGKAIEEIAIQRGHVIALTIDVDNQEELTSSNLARTDVAIEFTGPDSAFENVMKCLQASIPVVCGSTGWLDKLDEARQYAQSHHGCLLYSSNFSIGVNIFFELNKKLAELMSDHPEYLPGIREIHHTQKKDAPSGTAISLAEQILERTGSRKSWVNHATKNPEELEILSDRKDPVPGIHIVKYHSAIDDLEIIHTAHSRKGFAGGAILAAEFIRGKEGCFQMSDVLGF
jgi:4-hydroxy-tetrahydrodipicolinate reductase